MRDVFELEDLYDAGERRESGGPWPEGAELTRLAGEGLWRELLARSRALFFASSDPHRKTFCLLFGFGAADALASAPERDALATLWEEIPGWATNAYCLHMRAFQTGLGLFYSAHLREAASHFQLALHYAEEGAYPRGRVLALFHLGLIERDRCNTAAALSLLQRAKSQGGTRKRLLTRIETELARLADDSSAPGQSFFGSEKLRLEALLLDGKFPEARLALHGLELRRRALGLGRRHESLGAYLGLILCGLGRVGTGQRLISRIADPLLRLRILSLKKRSTGVCAEEESAAAYLRKALGVSQVLFDGDLSPELVEIAGVRLDSITDPAVRSLLLTMLARRAPLSKGDIVAGVWALSYDPVLHDKKVYNLIQKAKKLFGNAELFLNTYGSYEINPVLLGKESPRKRPA